MSDVTETQLLSDVPSELFIGGRWLPARAGETFSVADPATGRDLKEIADATPSEAVAALDAAVSSFESWSRTAPRERAEILRRAYELVIEKTDQFALLMTLEMGKPLAQAEGEVAYGAEFLRWFSEETPRVSGRYGTLPEGNGRMIVTKHPVGPAYLITPWNFPLAMATRKVGAALAAGCTVVVKPASQTPLTTLLLAKVFEEAGLPGGVLNVITTTDSAGVSEKLIADSRLRKLSFTGSTPVGVELLKQAANNVLSTSMELGGNAPFLVFADADLDAAAAGAMEAKFRNIGQACTAANRFLVARPVVEAFARKLVERVEALRVGRGTEPGVDIGPLIDERAVEKAQTLIDDAGDKGAHIFTGSQVLPATGHFLSPTVLTDVSSGSRILNEEIFAPVVVIVPFDDEEEAVRLANDTEYGLMSYAYTQDLARAQRLIETLQSGVMALNAGVASNAAGPFGGWKNSGKGREGGLEGIEAYLETKYTFTPNPF